MAERIIAARPRLPLLIARGQDQAVDLVALLKAGGVRAEDVVVYAQDLQSLTPAAQALLAGAGPVIAPLFSARTAAHLAAQPEVRSRRCPLIVAALSPAVCRGRCTGQARAAWSSHPGPRPRR